MTEINKLLTKFDNNIKYKPDKIEIFECIQELKRLNNKITELETFDTTELINYTVNKIHNDLETRRGEDDDDNY